MAGKKVWAYAKDKRTGFYVPGEAHEHKLYFIWEALALEDSDPIEFSHLQFVSTQRLEEDRKEVHTNRNGFFRYNPNQKPRGESKEDPDFDSLSHSLAIAAIAELKVLKFKCRGEAFSIHPTSVETEQRLQLISEGDYKYYVPDIVFTFDQDSRYAKRWGRKLVVEVMHTHACEGVKIKDFENHGIPIIEVKLNSMTLEEHAGTKSPNPEQMKEYYRYLNNAFSKVIYGEILSNPVSADFYRDNVTDAFERQRSAEQERDTVASEVERLKPFENALQEVTSDFKEHKRVVSARTKSIAEQINNKNNELAELKTQIQVANDKLSKTKKKLEETESKLREEKEKGLWDKLFGR